MQAAPSEALAAELLAQVPRSPDAFLHKLDLAREMVLLVELTASGYRSASFLDDRLLTPATRGAWVPLAAIEAVSRTLRATQPVHFIFHTGHVGSTLVSRLLDDTGTVLPIREPLPLRTLADAHDALGSPDSLLSEEQFNRALGTFMRLWGRGYQATRCTVVKATSSASRLASRTMSAEGPVRAIYLNLGAEPYLAALLAGKNSAADLRGHGPERMRRLQARTDWPLPALHSLTPGELAAMSWLAETCTQHDTLTHFSERVLAVDFDRFLSDIEESMRRILTHLGLRAGPGYLASVRSNPSLARYSKAPEHPYSPALRAEVLSESRRYNRAEIRKGLDWIAQCARADGAVAAILTAVEERNR